MTDDYAQMGIQDALSVLTGNSRKDTDGRWLEELTARIAPRVREWDISEAYVWREWTERASHLPGTTRQDVGIDVVAKRRSDGKHIAIQCKSRRLDELGRGAFISKSETDKDINLGHP